MKTPETITDPNTITNLLYEKSDQQLKEEIEAAFASAMQMITNGNANPYSIEYRSLDSEMKWNGWHIWEQFKKLAFNSLRDNRRKKAVHAFLKDFENLKDQLSDLQNTQQ